MFDFTRKQALCASLSVLFIGFVGQAESQTLSSQSVRPTAQGAGTRCTEIFFYRTVGRCILAYMELHHMIMIKNIFI